VGISAEGRPAGVWLSGGFLSEPTLIAVGYAIEQLLGARVTPDFAGSPPPPPPDAGICATLDSAAATRGRARAAGKRRKQMAHGRAGFRPMF